MEEKAKVPRDETASDRPRYEDLLRAAGAALDQDRAGHVTIVEVDDGFILRRERIGQTSVDLALSHVTRDSLKQLHRQLAEEHPAVVHRRTTLWSDFTHSHQDFFRSLGYELDSVSAQNIVVDELSEGLLVCYEQTDSANQVTSMRETILGRDGIEELLNQAVLRRASVTKREHAERPADPAPLKLEQPADPQETKWTTARTDLPYQEILSILGAFLEQQGAKDAILLEAPDGMVVRYRQGKDGALNWNRFTDHEILELGSSLQRVSRVLRRAVSRRSGGYQDLLFALGHELEAEHSSGILIGEQDTGLTVAFQYLDPLRSYRPRKGTISLAPGEQEALRRSARDRKGAGTHFLQRMTHRR